jgi:glutaredoxin
MLTTAILYTMKGCSKCKIMKGFLQEQKIPFDEVDLLEKPERSNEIFQMNSEIIVPFLYYQGVSYMYHSEWRDKLKI